MVNESCTWSHKWEKWCDPYETEYTVINKSSGDKYQKIVVMQKRKCKVCNEHEYKRVLE